MINPIPVVKKGDAFEDTMMLIDIMKQKAEKENKRKKVSGGGGGQACKKYFLSGIRIFSRPICLKTRKRVYIKRCKTKSKINFKSMNKLSDE